MEWLYLSRLAKDCQTWYDPFGVEVLIGMKPSCCLADLVREIKKSSNDFINENEFTKYRFYWQECYGAFSYSMSDLNNVYNYIKNQKEHHKRQSFRSEYLTFLRDFQIDFKEEYLFEWLE